MYFVLLLFYFSRNEVISDDGSPPVLAVIYVLKLLYMFFCMDLKECGNELKEKRQGAKKLLTPNHFYFNNV